MLYLDILFAYGEKLVAVIRQFSSIPQKQVFTFEDWIQAVCVFNKQEEPVQFVEVGCVHYYSFYTIIITLFFVERNFSCGIL